ncbi:MAG: hypothetical protein MJZ99_00885 [Bacteroidales bacterium]|nr:hypothetical protein [Bacteroidales bacterium]
MKKMFFAAAMLAGAFFMTACNNNATDVVLDSVTDEPEVVDTLKYVANPMNDDQTVEFLIANDKLVGAMANGEEKCCVMKKESVVVYGEAEPTALVDSLKQSYKMVKCINASVVDRMNHGEKNTAWIVLYTNEECGGCCQK